jgi:hypothetical protein
MPFRAILFLILIGQTVGQKPTAPTIPPLPDAEKPGETRLPNGKLQSDELLKDDRDKNLQDVRRLIDIAQAIQKDLEVKNSQQVLNLNDVKGTEEIEKLAKRIRSRIRHN